MANEELVAAVKRIAALARGGHLDQAYQGYRDIFSSPVFQTYRPEDQRQVLRLMILAKNVPRPPSGPMLEAHRASVPALTELVSVHAEPSDHELLGICHVVLGHEDAASDHLSRRSEHRARAEPGIRPLRRADEADLDDLARWSTMAPG